MKLKAGDMAPSGVKASLPGLTQARRKEMDIEGMSLETHTHWTVVVDENYNDANVIFERRKNTEKWPITEAKKIILEEWIDDEDIKEAGNSKDI